MVYTSSFCNEAYNGMNTSVPDGWIEIYDVNDLKKIGKESTYPLSGNYILMNNITFTSSDYNDDYGWDPIGKSATPFNGQFDGNGHYIKDLYINRPKQNLVGLFGVVHGSNGKIENVTLININITGENFVGSLVGYCGEAIIENSYAVGKTSGISEYIDYEWNEIEDWIPKNSYYDKDKSGLVSDDALFARDTAEMKQKSTYVDWDDTIWCFEEGEYPKLYWQR